MLISDRLMKIKPSGVRRIFDLARQMKDPINLSIGEPDFDIPGPLKEEGIEWIKKGFNKYTPTQGIPELREKIASHLKKKGVHFEEVMVTSGVTGGLLLASLALINPGDEVIIPTPCFVSYQAEVILAGGVAVEIPAREENDFCIDPDDIRKAITPRTKCIFIGYPSNPTGAVATREVMLEIAKIAEEHDLLVVSDEIYDRLVYDFKHVCFPALSEDLKKRTILLGGFSKDYAMTGWRIGYACGPVDIIQGLVRIHQYTIMSAPTTAQDAALAALQQGEPHVQEMIAEYDRRRRLLVAGLNRLGLHCFEPRGAFYTFPNIQASGMSDEDFAEKLLREERVAVVPGNAFGPGGEGFARMCYATEYSKIEEALHRMEKFMNRYG